MGKDEEEMKHFYYLMVIGLQEALTRTLLILDTYYKVRKHL
jgi:hypothetical protein